MVYDTFLVVTNASSWMQHINFVVSVFTGGLRSYLQKRLENSEDDDAICFVNALCCNMNNEQMMKYYQHAT